MVISHKYRYVFVQTMKTASTAIAAELCQHYEGQMILRKHATLDEYLDQASDDEKSYFSFAGVRNPLDVAASRFALRRMGTRNTDRFQQEQTRFIRDTDGDFGAYFRRYGICREDGGAEVGIVPLTWRSPGFQSIDHIYHYEDLQAEFSTILRKIGVDQVRELPLENPTVGKADFLSYYDEDTLALAYTVYRPYLDRWGYEVPARFRAEGAPPQGVDRLPWVLSRLRHWLRAPGG